MSGGDLSDIGFTAPVFVSWFQQFLGLFFYYSFAYVGKRTDISTFTRFKWVRPRPDMLKVVFPVSLAFVLMVSAANLCLMYVQVSTYQVARSLTIIFTIVLTYVLLQETQSLLVLLGCSLMMSGFVLNSLDPTTLSLGGLVLGGASSLFQSIYNVLVKQKLPHLNHDTNLLLLYNMVWGSVLFLPFVFLSGEGKYFLELPIDPTKPEFGEKWFSLLGSAFLSILINLASFLCIKFTSPLTFNILGFTKSLFQSAGGILFLNDVVTLESLTSLLLSLTGTGIYSYAKYTEAEAKAAPPPLPTSKDEMETGEQSV